MKRYLLITTLLTSLLAAPTLAGLGEGVVAYYLGNYTQALKELAPLAEQGDAMAQSLLGEMYYKGRGVSQDHQQALSWFRKAAEQGNSLGQFGLGVAYNEGQGVPQDYQQAAFWFHKAAEKGHPSAQYNLGLMYFNGKGVPQDYKQATSFFHKAAEKGNVDAQNNLGFAYEKGKGVPQDYQQAVSWFRKAAEQGNATAQYNLGTMYEKGRGVSKDVVLAHMLYNLGATSGNENASESREIVTKEMTPRQIEEAQALTRNWKVGTPLPTKSKTGLVIVATAAHNDKPTSAPTSVASKIAQPVQYFRDCQDIGCPEMVWLPKGSFMMGSNDRSSEQPVHLVNINYDLAVGKYPVTFAQWDACYAAGGCRGPVRLDWGWGRDNRPVVGVSWEDAKQYTRWLSQITGKQYRLLSESEWEYAARAGSTTRYYWGNDIGQDNANCDGCGGQEKSKQTSPVGSFQPNKWGLYDMAGNVLNWVEDCWSNDYREVAGDGRAWTNEPCAVRVLRGGSWFHKPDALTSSYRNWDRQQLRRSYNGFRVARTN
jgi:formylglycine-generating enzyme required for sulfatase activity